MTTWIFLLATIAFILEATLTTVPWVLLVLIVLMIKMRKAWVLYLAVVLGILLDIFAFRVIGLTSFFYILFLFFIMQYERKYQIDAPVFAVAVTAISGGIFAIFFGYTSPVLHGIFSGIVGLCLFIIMQYIGTRYTMHDA